MTKVLVFESDAQFAESLRSGLAGYGCEVTVVDDGEVGIAEAEKNKPDLILLAIELPRMNGFSVCNKLKRAPTLKDVPLVLMSTEATEETFEQHKRLRTRAEDYVHKPIKVVDLVARIQPIVPLEGGSDSQLGESTIDLTPSELEPFDETDAAFGNLMSPEPSKPPPPPAQPPPAADDILMDELELDPDDGVEIAEPPPPPPRSAPERSAPDVNVEVQPSAPSEAVLAELEELRVKVRELTSAHADAESKLKQADDGLKQALAAKDQLGSKKDAELELLQKEVDELKTKVTSNQGAGSAREFLDLREQLNKKDKELIELRDQLTSNQRETVKLNDSNIALERDKADLSDQVRDLEGVKATLEKSVAALGDDKAQANKRADDYKTKSERLAEDLAAKVSELKSAKEAHETTIVQRDASEAAAREDHRNQLAAALAQAKKDEEAAVERAIDATRALEKKNQEAALASAAVDADKSQQLAIATRETELRAEHDSKMAALHRANEESLRKLRAEHQQALDEALQGAQDKLLAREKELRAEKEAELAEQKAASDASLAKLAGDKAEAEASRDARIAALGADLATRTSERDAHAATLESREARIASLEAEVAAKEAALASEKSTVVERDARIAKLEAEIASVRADLVATTDKLGVESSLLSQARSKWQSDKSALESAKNSLTQIASDLEAALGREMP